MVHVVLVAPEIATNTGNIIRLCANAGAVLHLVEPLGFSLDDRALRRAGLDYRELADVRVHSSWPDCEAALPPRAARYGLTAHASRRYDEVVFEIDAVCVFGTESDGLPTWLLAEFDDAHRLAIPMRAENRSLNLANAVSIVVYEAWRQHGFSGAAQDAGATTNETPGR